MNMQEYEKVKDFNYDKYCAYLKNKYGEAKYNYLTKSYNKVQKVTRTKEGLFCHHIKEDTFIDLTNPECAKIAPFEYQLAENLVYCDYLEHLFLHILITEETNWKETYPMLCGIGGVINFVVPELNDLYSGYPITLPWKENVFNKVKDDYDVYIKLVKRFKATCKDNPGYSEAQLYSSYNENFGTWSNNKNKKIYEDLKK